MQLGFIRRLLVSESYLLASICSGLTPRPGIAGLATTCPMTLRSLRSRAGDIGNVTFGYFVEGEVRAVAELRPDVLMRQDSAEVAFRSNGHSSIEASQRN